MKGKMQKSKLILLTSLFLISTFTILFPIENSSAETYQTIVKLLPTDDTYISHCATDGNYGASEKIVVRNDYGYIGSSGWRWDALINFNIYPIIKGTRILSAKLKTYCYEQNYYNQSNLSLCIYRITNNWNEENITWDNQPSYASENSSHIIVPAFEDSWLEWDVTPDVQDYINGTISCYGWKITDENNWGHFNIPEFIFRSKETNDTEQQPYLEIELISRYPQADFFYNVSNIDKKVYFFYNSTNPNGTIISWFWEFGDGTSSNQQNTSHIYKDYGIYTVNLTITDNIGTMIKKTKTVTISIEEKIKKEIEKQYDITLNEDLYLNNQNELIDPNNILYVEQNFYLDNTLSFLISINQDMDKIFIWNIKEDNITIVKHEYGNIINNFYDNESSRYIVNIRVNDTNWTYIKVMDHYMNHTSLTIKRSDNTTVPEERIWRNNDTVYFLDNLSTTYQMIYNASSNDDEDSLESTIQDNEFLLSVIYIIGIIYLGILCFFEYHHRRKKALSFYIKQGNDKINEIDKLRLKIKFKN